MATPTRERVKFVGPAGDVLHVTLLRMLVLCRLYAAPVHLYVYIGAIIYGAITGEVWHFSAFYITLRGPIFPLLGVYTSGPTPQVANSAVLMSAQANKETKKRRRGKKKTKKKKTKQQKKNIERDSNSGRLTHRQ